MQKILLLGLVIPFLCILCLAAVPTQAKADTYRAAIGGGPAGGVFNIFANAMAAYVPRFIDGLQLSAVGSGGSVENVQRIDSGEFEFGLCYAVDSALGRQGLLPLDEVRYENVRALGFLYGAPAQLVVQADSPITAAADLIGKRVAVGNVGSGAAASAERFFRHIGVWDEFKPQFLGYSAAATALIEGKIDAFWVLVGYPNPSVAETAGQAAVRLIDVDQTARASDFYDAYAYMPTTIPAGTYGSGQPACATFQDATLLCANRDVPDEIVHGILQRLWSPAGIEAMSGTRETFAAMSVTDGIAGVSIPMHPGAVKFWTEQGKTLPADLKP